MEDFRNPVELSLASSGSRFVNMFIDNILLNVANSVFSFIFELMLGTYFLENFIINNEFGFIFTYILIFLIFSVFFYTLQEYFFKGRTVAKFVTKTQVVTVNGEEPTFTDYFIRSLCRFIPFDTLSFLFKIPGWHDTLSKTRVVKVEDFERNKTKFNEIDKIGQA